MNLFGIWGNNMVKISVILPVFNAEKYIEQAVLSVLNQSFSDFELIILNDGSTDSTKKILDSFNTLVFRLI